MTLIMHKENGYSEYFDIYDNLSDKIYNNLQDYDNFSGFDNKTAHVPHMGD